MTDLLQDHGIAVALETEGTHGRIERTMLDGGFAEVILTLEAGSEPVERAAVTFSFDSEAFLPPSARVLTLGESRGAGRGVVALGELRADAEPAALEPIGVAMPRAGGTVRVRLGSYA